MTFNNIDNQTDATITIY